MNGVPFDTREPATTQPTKRALNSWWWGAALVLSGLLCCVLPPLDWQTMAFAQTGSPRTARPTRPKMVPITADEENAKPREPWQVLTEPEEENDNPIIEILVEGNVTIPDASILRIVKTRKGRKATAKSVREDVKALFETRWFTGVTPIYKKSDEGTILVFRVIEAPILDAITYKGNKKIKTRVLEGVTGLRKGGPFGVTLNREAARAIERYYKDKSYHFCKVTLIKGDSENDREAIFEIAEGPKTYVSATRFEGNGFFSPGELRLHLKTHTRIVSFIPLGGTYNPTDLDDDVAGLREYYQKVGFLEAKITAKAEFAEDKSHVVMVYSIVEGTRFKVGQILVKGNDVISDETIRKDFVLKENEYFNSDKLTRDVDGMTNKYGILGRLFAEINATPIFLPEQPGVVDIVYKINEDKVYRVRHVDVVMAGGNGNPSHTKDTVVLNQMLVAPGDLANKALIKKSERRIASSSFFANAQSGNPPKIDIRKVLDAKGRPPQSGLARAQGGSKEEEDQPVQTTERRKEPLFPIPDLRRNLPATADSSATDDLAKQPISTRPRSSATSRTAPSSRRPAVDEDRPVSRVNRPIRTKSAPVRTASETDEEAAEEPLIQESVRIRRKVSAPVIDPLIDPGTDATDAPPTRPTRARPKAGRSTYEGSQSAIENQKFLEQLFNGSEPEEESVATNDRGNTSFANVEESAGEQGQTDGEPYGRTGTLIRAQGPGLDGPPASNPLFNNSDGGNPQGNPFLNPSPDAQGWVDLVPSVTETQTGRISFGVGVNSNAGLLGNAVIDESNFDILRVPTSFRDITNGTAFRGGGQQFRIEAMPGTQVSRYSLSWRDPYFLDTNNSVGVSGFYFTRIYQHWTENRTGGSVRVGRQFDNYTSGVLTFRLEDVDLFNIPNNPPPILQQSLGHSLLSTIRVGLIHDTRDSAFLPTEGHFLEAAYEQAYGQFHYPRFDGIARRYFTTYQRADGEGRHILALNGNISYTGSDTPIYERLFAGGYANFRGFMFRGVTPFQNGVGIGGQWLALGSVEYIFPFTASEAVRGVLFTDFGTVQNAVSFSDVRVSVGVGTRIVIPAMGPLPIALDLGFPIARQPNDIHQLFSFYVGFLR
jgi:outer membrane protein insertion porin family